MARCTARTARARPSLAPRRRAARAASADNAKATQPSPAHAHRMSDDLLALDALTLSQALHARRVSCRELMAATLSRIARLNPRARALVNLADESALRRQADERDAELARGASRGWLHGLPQAIKDTGHALGFPSTLGSPLLARAMPAEDSLYVARMKAAGCIVIGKTNMPEFGLGSHTFNPLFGATPNAWDATRSAGGSSGGAAVALALRLLPVADGSDFMGSLRNPAGWNHVFGLRPSAGRVPGWPKPETWVSQLSTDGPMARTVRDLARLLDVQAGYDARAPLSLATEAGSFVPPPGASVRGLRIGWLGDLGGHLALEPGIADVCTQALQRMAEAGAVVEPAALGFSAEALWEAWLVWRRGLVAQTLAPLLAQPGARARIKPEALWEHDQGAGLGFAQFMQAAGVRSAYAAHMAGLMARYDALALPTAQVWPFEIEQTWPRRIGSRTMDTYHRWMEATIYATFAGLPAISVPAGFDADNRLPMGLQLIGRPRGDAALLALAAGYEALVPALLARRPPEGPPAAARPTEATP
ncbi:MAG: amidase [Burkholderiales bacterium]|nr:amidase [Burkholderiales bacterium]